VAAARPKRLMKSDCMDGDISRALIVLKKVSFP